LKNLFSPLATAWTSVTTHKLRSFLTILGVVIGVGAVITLMSIGKGTESTILSNLTSLGTNLIYVSPGSSTQGGVRGGFGSANSLTLEDAEDIAQNVSNIDAVAPSSTNGMQIVAGNQNMFVRVIGATIDYQVVFNTIVADGDFFNQDQFDRNMKIAVMGPNVATTLFGTDDPVGQNVRVGNNIFKVIGVLQSKGQSMASTDDAIIVPLSTLQGMMSRSITTTGQHIVSTIAVQVTDKDGVSTVKDEITSLLQTRHHIAFGADNDFTVTSMDEIANTISQAMNSFTMLLGAIAAISLLVGGIGVMNIMLVSVMERRREIGIRKALGAKERDIWGQFLVDSALLTFTGGIIGVAVGMGFSYLISYSGTMNTLVTPDIVVLAVAVSVGIGLFFGFYPAWQGSRMDPIQALRSE
jgi:putative ABC transport system permease protein